VPKPPRRNMAINVEKGLSRQDKLGTQRKDVVGPNLAAGGTQPGI